MEFELKAGESIQVFDGTLIRMRDKCVVYRIAVSSFSGADLKIIVEGGKTKMLTANSNIPVLDVAVSGALFLEATGNGSLSGICDALFGV